MQTDPHRPESEPQAELTLFYSDVSGFTEMTERLGDAVAFDVMRSHFALLRGLVARHGGREVEVRGDACLLAFESPDACIACAIDVHRALAEQRRATPARAVAVRIGLHTGRPIAHDGVLFGRDVILAARLADACPTNAILASRSFRRRLRDSRRIGRERRVRLKGLTEPEPVARIYWGARRQRARVRRGPLEAIALYGLRSLGEVTSRLGAARNPNLISS
jgi:class 3 adenylate cyclase